MSDPERALEPYVYVEPRESSQLTQLVASSVGSVVGQAAAKAARLGPIGALVGMIGGAVAGHWLSTHHVRLGEPRSRRNPRPERPAAYSDRR